MLIETRAKLKHGFIAGIGKGWSSFVWIAKFTVPISFLVALLQWSGILEQAGFILQPLTRLIGLPPEAALPILSGMLTNIYAVIASLSVLPFTMTQMTLIAIFSLIAHNLILEGVVQHKSGINVAKAVSIRIGTAIVAVLIISRFMNGGSESIGTTGGIVAHAPVMEALKSWAAGMGILLLKIFGILMAIMILLQIMTETGWMERLLKFFRPLMAVLGLPASTGIMFMSAAIFGLLYAGAVIVQESKNGKLSREEVERLHVSVGINHAMIEDPALFAVLGINLFWLWVPRLVMAMLAVQVYRVVRALNGKLRLGVKKQPGTRPDTF